MIETTIYKRLRFLGIGMLLCGALLISDGALAHNKVVVIPLLGDPGEPLQNIVTVAKNHGDFTTVSAALASISNASFSNPYLIVIGPGIYTVTSAIMMKSYVDIVGSGQKITTLQGSFSHTSPNAFSAVVVGASQSGLQSLTVRNTGGTSGFSQAIYNPVRTGVVIKDVTVIVFGSNITYGIYSRGGSVKIVDVTAVSIGSSNVGILNSQNASVQIENTQISSGAGSNSSFCCFGIRNISGSTANIVRVDASNASSGGIGLMLDSTAKAQVRYSHLEGQFAGIYITSVSAPFTLISHSSIVGPVAGSGNNASRLKCVNNDDGDVSTLNQICQ